MNLVARFITSRIWLEGGEADGWPTVAVADAVPASSAAARTALRARLDIRHRCEEATILASSIVDHAGGCVEHHRHAPSKDESYADLDLAPVAVDPLARDLPEVAPAERRVRLIPDQVVEGIVGLDAGFQPIVPDRDGLAHRHVHEPGTRPVQAVIGHGIGARRERRLRGEHAGVEPAIEGRRIDLRVPADG